MLWWIDYSWWTLFTILSFKYSNHVFNEVAWYNWSGVEGFCAWRRGLVQQLPGAAGGFGLGVFPLQHSGIQQGRVLGPTQGCIGPLGWGPRRDKQWHFPSEQWQRVGFRYSTALPRRVLLLFPSNELDPMAPTWPIRWRCGCLFRITRCLPNLYIGRLFVMMVVLIVKFYIQNVCRVNLI